MQKYIYKINPNNNFGTKIFVKDLDPILIKQVVDRIKNIRLRTIFSLGLDIIKRD